MSMSTWAIYRNLNCRTHTSWTIKADRKVGESSCLLLGDVTMKHATKAQRERCRSGGKRGKGCREVCQWLRAERYTDMASTEHRDHLEDVVVSHEWHRILCDPKKHDGFRDERDNPLNEAAMVLLMDDGRAFYTLGGEISYVHSIGR